MSSYIYKARDATGKLVRGTMEAISKEELIDKLQRMGYMTTQVTESSPGIKIESVFEKLKKVSTEDMIVFNIQLANMLNAGLSLLSSLNILSKQTENKKLKEIIGSVSRSVEAGDSFSQGLSRHSSVFSSLFINMVKAGEASGKLGRVLERYAQFIEHQADLRQKIKGALFYPIILLFAGLGVTLFIVTFIIPKFAEIFLKVGISLPLPTLILYNVGTGIKRFWYSIILFFIVGWWGIRYYANTQTGRLNFDRLKLRLPYFGSLYLKASVSRFGRTLGTLIGSGVPILQSLDITKEVTGNEVIAGVVGSVRRAVEKGEKISESLKISKEFPEDAVQMIAAGEETGELEGMLNKISDLYDMSLGYTIKKITTLVEPLLLVIMGCLVGFIMASMLLPMFDMMKILRRAG